jgi:hypothetical protein
MEVCDFRDDKVWRSAFALAITSRIKVRVGTELWKALGYIRGNMKASKFERERWKKRCEASWSRKDRSSGYGHMHADEMEAMEVSKCKVGWP